MGLLSAGDEFCRQVDAALTCVPNLVKVVDDLCQHGTELLTHVRDVYQLLVACRNNITLNSDKVQLFASEVEFAGYVLSEKGISSDPEKIDAIAKFPHPNNITQLRFFMGLAMQLADFSADISASVDISLYLDR